MLHEGDPDVIWMQHVMSSWKHVKFYWSCTVIRGHCVEVIGVCVCVLRPPAAPVDADPVDSSEDESIEMLKPTKVDIDLGLSAYANACKYVTCLSSDICRCDCCWLQSSCG